MRRGLLTANTGPDGPLAFVMKGDTTAYATSSSGTSWMGRTHPSSSYTYSIRQFPSQGLFVSASSGGKVYSSPDAVAWTSVGGSIFSASTVYDTAWSANSALYVAVAGSGKVATSPDLVTWTLRTSPSASSLTCIAYSPSLALLVVGDGVGGIMTSSDGITWTTRLSALTLQINRIAWSPVLSLFVAVDNGGKIATSSNGTNWTLRSSPVTDTLLDVTWSTELGLFIAVGYTGVFTSPDGVTWTSRSATAAYSIGWSPLAGLLVAGGFAGAYRTSPDGITWTAGSGANISSYASTVCGVGITAGVSPIPAASLGTNTRTYYSRDNPATATGTLTQVSYNTNTNGVTIYFISIDPVTLLVRAKSANLVTSIGKKMYPVNLPVVKGDWIGVVGSSGATQPYRDTVTSGAGAYSGSSVATVGGSVSFATAISGAPRLDLMGMS